MSKAETRALIKAIELLVGQSPNRKIAKKNIRIVHRELKEKEPTGHRSK